MKSERRTFASDLRDALRAQLDPLGHRREAIFEALDREHRQTLGRYLEDGERGQRGRAELEPPELDAYSAEETWRPRPPPRVDEDGLEDVDEDEDEEVNP